MQFHKKTTVVIFASLVLLMALTRTSHFGSSIHLPDATLAIFLIAGFMLPRFTVTALTAFIVLLLAAGGIDYYAINIAGVSDYCVTPAYWFLIPTYASMWLGGRWFAAHQQNNLRGLVLFGGVSWLATTIAFLISNASFYVLSAHFTDMSIMEYATRVAQYYPSYLGSSLMYLALAAIIYASLSHLNRTSSSSTQH